MLKRYLRKNNYEFYRNKSFRNITSIRVGGRIKYLIYPHNINELIKIVRYLIKHHYKYIIIGNGTNFVASDYFYRGVCLCLKKMRQNITEGKDTITVSASYSTSNLAIKMVERGYGDYAFLGCIPGVISGAVYMNAGCNNHQISELVKSVSFINQYGEIRTITKDNLKFSYRKSYFIDKNFVIIDVTLSKGRKGIYAIADLRNEKLKRSNKFPLENPNCGSIFRNPHGKYAGKLIESVGLKGARNGNASISIKHANFIINLGGATAQEIFELIKLSQRKVYDKYKIILEPEIILFNFKKREKRALLKDNPVNIEK